MELYVVKTGTGENKNQHYLIVDGFEDLNHFTASRRDTGCKIEFLGKVGGGGPYPFLDLRGAGKHRK